MQLKLELKDKILDFLQNIIDINDTDWITFNLNIKLKVIHHYCNFFINKDNFGSKNIPLKSQKPKKFIEFSGFNKQTNTKLFKTFLNNIQNLTIEYREKYIKIKKRVYYVISNLAFEESNSILIKYNLIVYNFLIENISLINSKKLFESLVGNNNDKIINLINNFKIINISIDDINLKLLFNNNININLELSYNSNKITNNIPVKYHIKLINFF